MSEKTLSRAVLYRLINRQPQILLTKELNGKKPINSEYQLFGGELEINEMPIDAMIRQLITEIDEFSETDQDQLWYALKAWGTHHDLETSWITSSFFLQIDQILENPELNLKTESSNEVKWLTQDELQFLAVTLNDLEIIDSFFDWIERQFKT